MRPNPALLPKLGAFSCFAELICAGGFSEEGEDWDEAERRAAKDDKLRVREGDDDAGRPRKKGRR